MTLRYRRGMTLGEFQDMIDQHRREQGDPGTAIPACSHPFDLLGLELNAAKVDGGLEIRARYQCGDCGDKWGARKLLRRKAAP